MNGISGFQEVRSSPPDHQRIGSRKSNGLNSETVPDTVSFLHTANNPQESPNIFTMRGALVFIVGFLLIGTSAGCSFFTPPASEEKLHSNQSYWFHYEAARRGGFLVGTDSTGKANVKMCAEPAPDVALARTAEFILKGAYQGVTGQAQAKLAEQLAQLGGRTETVLILRESLFRLCELSINSGLPASDLKELYKTVVVAVVSLAQTDLTKAETERMKTFNSLPPANQQQFAPQYVHEKYAALFGRKNLNDSRAMEREKVPDTIIRFLAPLSDSAIPERDAKL